MKILRIVIYLGLILSTGGMVYSSMQYLALSHSAKAIEALTRGQDVMASKIGATLADHKDKDLILDELMRRQENAASLHAALTRLATSAKVTALGETLLWIGVSVLFVVSLIRLEALRRREKSLTVLSSVRLNCKQTQLVIRNDVFWCCGIEPQGA